MKKLTKYFFEGLLFLVPVLVSIYIIYAVFIKIDSFFDFPVKGLGFISTILIITVIGFLGSSFLARGMLGLVDSVFRRLPLVKLIYTSVRDLVGAFVIEKKGFSKPVLVELVPGSGTREMGFLTNEDMCAMGINDSVSVYLPLCYSFAGKLVIVRREQVTPLDAEGSEVMKFIVSGGISSK